MLNWIRISVGAGLALMAVTSANAQISCGQYDFPAGYKDAFVAGEPLADAENAAEIISTMPDGVCHQDQVVEALSQILGPVVGYKAAATSAPAQTALKLDGPVLGVLLRNMILPDGATVAIDDGARLVVELDLIARIGSSKINEANTPEEALAGIDVFLPFIELGDLMVPKGAAMTGPLLAAMNAGARYGVLGKPIPATTLSMDDLAGVSGTLSRDGGVVSEAGATALLGHPANAIHWIVEQTRARGVTLEPGALLSLGSLGPFQLATPGTFTATYTGFGDEPVSVTATLE